ncbi:urease accessory protein UreH domain-containing protein [Deinococcus sp. UYEF24]
MKSPVLRSGRPSLAIGLLLGVFVVVITAFWPQLHLTLKTLASATYAAVSELGAGVVTPLNVLRLQAGTSLLVPLLLGLMAVTAPCQLSTGTAALAFVVRAPESGHALSRATAFLLARVLMYSGLGLIAVLFFGGRLGSPGEGLLLIRRLIGPLMVLSSLVLLGVLRPVFPAGGRLSQALDRWSRARGGVVGAFLLGVAFSLSFCPTLFFLFFGLTVPMSVTAPLGVLYPALFALGMTFPLLTVSTLFTGRTAEQARTITRRTVRLNRVLTPLAGIVFLLAGLFDTFVYWLL